MRAQTIDVKTATGRVLCCTVFRSGGKKLLAKGHVISDEDVRVLESEGMQKIWVTELEDGEVGEDDAVCAVAGEMGCGAYEIRLAAGGRANLIATEECCVLVDDDLLKQINCTSSVVIATSPNFSFAPAGQRIATVKSAPFAISKEQLEAVTSILKDRGPILQARPVRSPVVAVLYTDPINGERARQLFENIMRQRLERFGAASNFVLCALEEEATVGRALQHLMRTRPSVILVASTTGAGRSGRRDRPGHGTYRRTGREIPGPGGAGQSSAVKLQRRRAHYFGAGVFPVGEAERRGFDFAALVGEVPRLGLGDCLPGTRWVVGLTRVSSTPRAVPPSGPRHPRPGARPAPGYFSILFSIMRRDRALRCYLPCSVLRIKYVFGLVHPVFWDIISLR